MLYIRGISLYPVVVANLDTESLKALLESVCGRLTLISCKNNGAYIKTDLGEYIEKTDDVNIIGYAEVAANLVFFNIVRINDDNYLCLIFKLQKHLELAVGLESRENS